MKETFEDFSRECAQAIAEVVEAHGAAFDGRRVKGMALCPVDDYLVPYLGVVFAETTDDPEAPIEDLYVRWSPDESGRGISNGRLDEVTGGTNDLAFHWPEEDWDRFGPQLRDALVAALGSTVVRDALARVGWNPILYLFMTGEGLVDADSLPTFNPGRRTDPDYRALERLT